jgi:oligoribonuclease NrnB/cAMP/cGMP phosphodiesterase (DHH superfamily)
MDGYTCQLISQKIFPDGYFINANYGLEVKLHIKEVLHKIEQCGLDEAILLLITDLNLTTDESKNLDNAISNLKQKGFDITLQLLDHHATGSKSAKRYDWYFLDTSRSATKITYEYFIEHYGEEFLTHCENNFDKLIQAVNAADIWLENDPLFEFGKVCMSMVTKSREVNDTLFPNDHRAYKHFLLLSSLPYITQENGHILLDENIYFHKKKFLNQTNNNNTMDNLTSEYLVKLLDTKKEDLTVYYKEHKGLLTYALGNISISANGFLKANPDYHFFMDVGRRGRVGFRAANKLDVSILAQKLAGGGGHPNASGASFDDFKETPLYPEVKTYIQNKLDQCE